MYPLCECGCRFDSHRGPGDPRGEGCWLCPCANYRPVPYAATPDEDDREWFIDDHILDAEFIDAR